MWTKGFGLIHSFNTHLPGAFSVPVSGTQHSVENREIVMMKHTDCGSECVMVEEGEYFLVECSEKAKI